MAEGDLFDKTPPDAEPADPAQLLLDTLAYGKYAQKGMVRQVIKEWGLPACYDACQQLRMEMRQNPVVDDKGRKRIRPTLEELEIYLAGGREEQSQLREQRSKAELVERILGKYSGIDLAKKIGCKAYQVQERLMGMAYDQLQELAR